MNKTAMVIPVIATEIHASTADNDGIEGDANRQRWRLALNKTAIVIPVLVTGIHASTANTGGRVVI
ncbi:hypothetical protein GTW25_18140 [Aliihoeflea aestuarii]|uniref:hypothetical protein n=1 Tax=Aliihoeflea aestuarii TaxID=453840 RepID=UPI002095A936|nr:hypothetical protein [Aliihoeflea aestuarii]MCO6392947.1 hypothetical protein [Aliihoeflea aestuarii]